MSDLRKDSLSTTSTSPKRGPAPPYQQQQAQNNGCMYPSSEPGRRLYMTARALSMLFGLVLIAVSVAAFLIPPKQDTWLSPVLSPAVSAFIHSGLDLLRVCRSPSRAHRRCGGGC